MLKEQGNVWRLSLLHWFLRAMNVLTATWFAFSSFMKKSSGNGILYEEIKKLEDFSTSWVEKLSTVVLRGFEVCCRDYLKNKKQWQEKGEEGWMVSQEKGEEGWKLFSRDLSNSAQKNGK